MLASFSTPEALLPAHGEALLASGDNAQLIYVTTSPDYAVDAFALQAAHYLFKPFTAAQFDEAMDRAANDVDFGARAPRARTFSLSYTEFQPNCHGPRAEAAERQVLPLCAGQLG